MMKKAHKYLLKVEWSDETEWNINILAISMDWVFLWVNSQSDKSDFYVTNIIIELIERDVEDVPDEFGARGLD